MYTDPIRDERIRQCIISLLTAIDFSLSESKSSGTITWPLSNASRLFDPVGIMRKVSSMFKEKSKIGLTPQDIVHLPRINLFRYHPSIPKYALLTPCIFLDIVKDVIQALSDTKK